MPAKQTRSSRPVALTAPPSPAGAATVEELSARLRQLQVWSGAPYREIHRRVVRSRQARGIAESPALNTVYRCLLPGRRRLDAELVVDIARVLLEDDALAAEWRQAHQVVTRRAAEASVVAVADVVQDDAGVFTGRAGELAEGMAAFEAGTAKGLLLIEGMPGVGKTRLAVRLAHGLLGRGHGADLQLSVNLRGYDPDRPPADPAAVLDGFLRRLGLPASRIHALDLAGRAAAFRELTAGRKMVVLLDNAADSDQVSPLLPDGPDCFTVVTSRRRLSGLAGGRRLRLDVFTPAESLDLLRRSIGAARVDNDPATAEQIAALAGHLPLALGVLAGRIASTPAWTLTDHLERLTEHRLRLRLDDGVMLALSSSYESLAVGNQMMLRLLALHPGRDCDVAAAAALAGVDQEEAFRQLSELAGANLLQERVAGRYELHDLIRVLASDRGRDQDPASVRGAAMDRLFGYYRTATASAVTAHAPHDTARWAEVCDPEIPDTFSEQAVARSWLDSEGANLIATALFAADHGRPQFTTDLSLMLHYYFDTAGYFQEAETLHLAAVRCAVGDASRGRSYNSLGCIYWRLGRYADGRASYLQALELARAQGDRLGEGRGLTNVALGHFRLGEYADAIEYQRQALAIFEELDMPARVCITLAGLGWAELRLGRSKIALRHFRRSLEAARSLGGGTCEEAYALANVGAAAELSGAVVEARQHYELALELSSQLDFPVGQTDALNSLGRLHLADGRVDWALRFHRDALTLSEQIGNRPFTIEVRNDYGAALVAAGRLDDAFAQHQAALLDAEALDDRYELARACVGLAAIHATNAADDRADQLRRRALDIFITLGCPEARAVQALLPEISGTHPESTSTSAG